MLNYDLLDEEVFTIEEGEERPRWEMYFDEESSIKKTSGSIPIMYARIGLIFITPEGGILRHLLPLTRPHTNNEVKYKALLARMEIVVSMGIQRIKIFDDS